MTTRVLLAEDHAIVRQGLRLIIEQEDDMTVVAEAADGREAVQVVRKVVPDLVIMDINMPHLNGIDASVQIMSEHPDIKLLILSALCDKHVVTDVLHASISGYVLKDTVSDELIHAIRTVMAGNQYLSPEVASVVVSLYISDAQSSHDRPVGKQLTSREREVIQLLTEGYASKEAARILHVSVKTIDARRRVIMEKLSIDNLADLTKYAIQESLTTVEYRRKTE